MRDENFFNKRNPDTKNTWLENKGKNKKEGRIISAELKSISFDDDPYALDDFKEDINMTFEDHIGKGVRVIGTNLGWEKRTGEMRFVLNDPQEIWQRVKPDTDDFTFTIEKLSRHKYRGICCHHDVPTGENYIYIFSKGEKE